MKALLMLVALWWSWQAAYTDCPLCASDEICNATTSSCDCVLAQYTVTGNLTLQINCSRESMDVTLLRCQLEKDQLDPDALHYADRACKGVRAITGDKAVVTVSTMPSNGTCGNVLTSNGTHVMLSNTLTIPAIVEGSSQTVGISCTYDIISWSRSMRSVLMPLFITTWSTTLEGFGNFSAQMTLYWDAFLREPVQLSDVLYVEDNVFIGVEVPELDDNQFSVLVKNLFATPVADPSAPRFDLIMEGCPNSVGVNLLVKQNGHTKLASFEMSIFKIVGYDSIVLFADLDLCDNSCPPACLENAI